MTRSRLVTGLHCLFLSAATLGAQTPKTELPTVAVMDFSASSLRRDAPYEDLGRGIASMLNVELGHNPAINVIERGNLRRLLEEQQLDSSGRVDPATAARIGRVLGARHMIFGGFLVDLKGRMRLDAWAVNVETSEIEYVATKTRSVDEVIDLVKELAGEMNRGMHLPPMPERSRPVPARAITQKDQGRAVMLYSNAVREKDRGNRPRAVDLCRSALSIFPEYEAARELLALLERQG